jgi:integrase
VSIHTFSRTVAQFLNWCRSEGEAVSGKPQLPRLGRRVIDVLSREEIDTMEDAAPTERDKLIIRILADTGIRVGGLCGLTPDSLMVRDRRTFLMVHEKDGNDRLVPLSPTLSRRLERYIRHRPADTSSDHIFLSLRRSPHGDYKKRVYPHLFRHSFATEALRQGMNPIQLARVLGHNSLRMIERTYSHLDQTDAYDAVLKMLASNSRRR